MFVLTHPQAFARRAAIRPVWSRAVERLLDEQTETPQATAQVPAMDVSETDTAYTLNFDLPGIVKEQVKVTLDGRRVSVDAAPSEAAADAADARILYRERSAPRFARTLTLPVELDATGTTAAFVDGVLTLNIAKKAVAGPTTITVV